MLIHCGYCGHEFECEEEKPTEVKCPKCGRNLMYFTKPVEVERRLISWGY